MSDLKDHITEETELEVDDSDVEECTQHPVVKKRVYIELVKPNNNAQLYNIEEIIDSNIAILLNRQAAEGELTKSDWRKLNDIVKMKLDISKLELNTKKTSILEGKTNEEIIELVEIAKASLTDGDDDE